MLFSPLLSFIVLGYFLLPVLHLPFSLFPLLIKSTESLSLIKNIIFVAILWTVRSGFIVTSTLVIC